MVLAVLISYQLSMSALLDHSTFVEHGNLVAELAARQAVADVDRSFVTGDIVELGDPLLNSHHALALKIATYRELQTIQRNALRINGILQDFWAKCGVTLVDFKMEFGRLSDGTIVLADEISPDTCRLWDSDTEEKLDKDRFRRDLGGVEQAYAEIMRRLEEHL